MSTIQIKRYYPPSLIRLENIRRSKYKAPNDFIYRSEALKQERIIVRNGEIEYSSELWKDYAYPM